MTKKDREIIEQLTARLENLNTSVKRDFTYIVWNLSITHICTFESNKEYNINDIIFLNDNIYFVQDLIYVHKYDVYLMIASIHRKEFSPVPGDCSRYIYEAINVIDDNPNNFLKPTERL